MRLENEDTGVVCYDRLIPGNEFISGGPAGRIIQISADDTEAPGLFQRGSYKVRITNEDPEKKLFLSVVEDEDKVNAEEKEEAEANRHLDFAVIRTSGIGYGVAFFVIFILCAYMIAVASLLTGPGFSMRRLFVFSAVPLSVIYLVLFSPWTIPDNKDHFWAAYRISGMILREEGADEWKMRADDALFYDGHQSPENPGTGNIGEMFWNVCLQARDESRVSTEPSDKMRCYSILNYLPQTVGLTIGRLLGLGTVLTMTLARILMLAVYIAACAHAVQITPLGKAVFAAVPLLPMSLMLSGSFSYDAMVLVSTLCFTASVLRAREESESLFALAECVAWAVVLGGVKGGAFLIFLPLALMLLPQSLQSSQRLRAGNNLLRPGIVIAAGALSALFFDVLLAPDGLYQLGEEGTSTMRASFALIHPLKFLCLLASTYLNSADELILNMGGTRLAWLEATIPAAVIGALLVIIAVQSVFEKDRIRLRGRDRGLFLWVLAMEIVFTPIMLLSWTEYGDDRIRGLQGRYYLPVFLMLVFVFTKYTLHEQADQSGSLVSGSTELVESENNNNTGSDPGLVVRKCVGWFCGLSCLCVYYLMRLYLVR